MKNRKECSMIQDLLPNYIENLTKPETKQMMEEHLADCKDCKKVLEDMKKELDLKQKKPETKEINYIKKYHKKLKLVSAALLVFVLLFSIIMIRRVAILLTISQKTGAMAALKNYHVTLYSYAGDSMKILETYRKEDSILIQWTSYQQDAETIYQTVYKNAEEQFMLIQKGDKKIKQDIVVEVNSLAGVYYAEGFWNNLGNALLLGIDSTYCNGKACYVLKSANEDKYIDKQTGLTVRIIDKSSKENLNQMDRIVDYQYEINVVTQEKVQKPEITGYIQKN